jgi:ribosomal protein L16 Arg81 hydroxylase
MAKKKPRGGMAGRQHNLSAILSPEEMEKFTAARRDQAPFLATGNRDRLTDYFGIGEFERLLNQTGIWTPDRLEVLFDNRKVPAPNFFNQLAIFNGVRYRLEPEKLQQILGKGASLVLNDIDGLTEGLKTLKGLLADISGARVESNLYYSQPGHQAFSVHFDVHDVFAFQVEGRKRWRVYQQAHRFPINHLAFLSGDTAAHEKAKGSVSMEFVLEPGDLIYLPAGYYHQAICTDSVSVHLSFSAIEMRGLDVISELFDKAVLEEFFRTPVDRAGGGALPAEDYVKLLAGNIEQLLTSRQFIEAIKQNQRSFPHPTGKISIPK